MKANLFHIITRYLALLLAAQIICLSVKAKTESAIKFKLIVCHNGIILKHTHEKEAPTMPFESKGETESSASLSLEEEAEFLEDFKTEKGLLINPPIHNSILSFNYTAKRFLSFHPEMQSPPPKA